MGLSFIPESPPSTAASACRIPRGEPARARGLAALAEARGRVAAADDVELVAARAREPRAAGGRRVALGRTGDRARGPAPPRPREARRALSGLVLAASNANPR